MQEVEAGGLHGRARGPTFKGLTDEYEYENEYENDDEYVYELLDEHETEKQNDNGYLNELRWARGSYSSNVLLLVLVLVLVSMKYERRTAASVADVLRLAEEILTERLPTEKVASDAHSMRFTGGDGAVTISAHRHGLETVVHVTTDQLRTSRLDGEVQYFMTMLPYQPGDVRGAGTALPGGLSRS